MTDLAATIRPRMPALIRAARELARERELQELETLRRIKAAAERGDSASIIAIVNPLVTQKEQRCAS